MKKIIFFSIYVLLLIGFLTSCNNDNDLSPDSSISEIVTQNTTWKITYFWDKDKDETHKLQDYTFEFKDDGTLNAIKNGSIVQTGTWSVNSSSNKFIINTGTTSDPLDEMNDDWLIQEKSSSIIKLIDDNDQHLEELYLEKI